MSSEALPRIRVGDLDVAFRRRGHGPPLVLLHGGLCDSRVWHRQLDELGDEFSVLAWDAPGCGASSDPPEAFRLPDYADVLHALMHTLNLDRPHLLGHSWGSGLALELCRRHPGTIASLVLAGGYAGWAGSLPPDEVARRLELALNLADALPGYDPRSVPGLFSDAMPVEQQHLLVEVMTEIRPVGTRVMAQAIAEADLRDALPGIDVPTLLLYGDADDRSPPDVAQALHAALPNSTLVFMPGLGHEAYAESPAAFDAHVRAFLSTVDASSPAPLRATPER
jgi:pimeloyl-ACP methyl ester carboxylesterase